MKRPTPFTLTEIRRIIKAADERGLPVTVTMKDGTIIKVGSDTSEKRVDDTPPITL